MKKFKLLSPFSPAGDQPKAIKTITENFLSGIKDQVLLGVTGSGKTFTMANVIANLNKPTLVISHNKTLAAQLYAEFKEFFPYNAVEYFVSYYDYYQPEAYIPSSDTYIEKDASINEHLDRLRLKATSNLLSRDDVIVVASVSCIYNIGSPQDFQNMGIFLEVGQEISIENFTQSLVDMRYERNNIDFSRNKFRSHGDIVDIWPSYLETFFRIEFDENKIVKITEYEYLSNKPIFNHKKVYIYPASHFVVEKPKFYEALKNIELDLQKRIQEFKQQGKLLEAQRIEQRTKNDLELLRETGFCHGIENYSRYFSGRAPGSRPYCLLDYFRNCSTMEKNVVKPRDFLCIIDESHVTIPQIYGMYEGDSSRKQVLVDYGFRLPSALDNRPLKFEEFLSLLGQTLYVSATPSEWEIKRSNNIVVEQIIRPTGLVDPEVIIKPATKQVQDVVEEIKKVVKQKQRVLISTLTKRIAEDLAEYLQSQNFRVKYIHSDIDVLTRISIIKDLRKGEFDCLVGVNLLREGLDLPEVSLVAILDADKEGFLRNATTLIQISGRAARNVNGKIILYANNKTKSIISAVKEMSRRRELQLQYNKQHNIVPKSIIKAVRELEEFQVSSRMKHLSEIKEFDTENLTKENVTKIRHMLETEMKKAAELLDFETAIIYRDKLKFFNEMVAEKNFLRRKFVDES
jgi:excinuclease ABC subunit B